jgi:hypothetical protein
MAAPAYQISRKSSDQFKLLERDTDRRTDGQTERERRTGVLTSPLSFFERKPTI